MRASGLPFDDVSFESRMVWILGSPRTGSTWLLRLLIHPLTLIDDAPGFAVPRRHRIDRNAVIPLDEPYLPVHLSPPLFYAPFEPGTRPNPADFLQNTVRRGDPSYFFSDAYADVWRPEVRRLALVRFRAQIEDGAGAEAADRAVVAIKEPNGSDGAELLMSLFPRAKMIFLIRDGRDVMDSLIRATAPGGWHEQQGKALSLHQEEQRASFVKSQSQRWVIRMEAAGRAFERLPGNQRYEIQYEELLTRPGASLRRLSNFLGVERSHDELTAALNHAAQGQSPQAAGGWRDNLTEREQEIMHDIMGFKLEELGYVAGP